MPLTTVPVCLSVSPSEYTFEKDWYGQPPRYQARFSLSLQGDILTYRFCADKTPECLTELSRGDFVEGLWQYDVAEFFVLAPDGRYQEFNLSPTGAWWSAVFSSYRQDATPVRLNSVSTIAKYDEASWSAELSVALADLVVLGQDGLRGAKLSLTSILSPGDPEYLCWGHQSGGEPDFHRPDTFRPVSWVTKA